MKNLRLSPRRGATIILVSILMVGLITLLAGVLDMSRMYVQKNELQTAADAGALAGVKEIYGDTSLVKTTAISFATQNKTFKQTPTVAAADVVCGTWDDAAQTFSATGICGGSANAVVVSAHAPAQSVLTSFFNLGSKTVTATSYAWLAPVGSSDCVKPFGMPHQQLTKLLQPANPDTFRLLTDTDFEIMRSMTTQQLTVTLYGTLEAPGSKGILDLRQTLDFPDNIWDCSRGQYLKNGDIIGVLTGFKAGQVQSGEDKFCTRIGGSDACYDSNNQLGKPAKIVTYGAPLGKCAGVNCDLPVLELVGFSMDTMSNKDVIGHFVPISSNGTIGSGPSSVSRPILVK